MKYRLLLGGQTSITEYSSSSSSIVDSSFSDSSNSLNNIEKFYLISHQQCEI